MVSYVSLNHRLSLSLHQCVRLSLLQSELVTPFYVHTIAIKSSWKTSVWGVRKGNLQKMDSLRFVTK